MFGKESFMNIIQFAITSALSAATLVSDALLNPHVALELAQQPQSVADVRGLDIQTVQMSASVVEKGQKSVSLSFWV